MRKISRNSRKNKQEEMLNDDEIIIKVQNSLVRKVFTIDVGHISPNRIQKILTKIKHKIEDMRRI